MNLILDACTAIHLLQTDIQKDNLEELSFNNDFFSLLNKLEERIVILPKVFNEIKDNFDKNLKEVADIKFLNSYIQKKFNKFVEYKSDYEEVIPFVKKVHCYTDNNGELHCSSYALYESRYEKETLYETFLFTDDDGAISDFEDFFKINSIGSILTTIDLLNILYRKSIIPKKVVLDFALSLKRLYISDLSKLLNLIDKSRLSEGKKGIQERTLLTNIREQLNLTKFDKVKEELFNQFEIYSGIKTHNKELDKLLQKVITSDYKKIKTLNEKINHLRHKVWEV
tara:strand:- start:19726 stop:20574 length:849 start_codon:yes stop_codon:yes gene_type:complete